MRISPYLLKFLLMLLIGLLLYGLFFGLVARRPQSAGVINAYFDLKLNYASAIKDPKLMLLGASNVRYSHRCETIAAALTVPCVNAGINNEVAVDVLLTKFESVLNPGDSVYLPLSYEPYMWSQATLDSLFSSVYLYQHEPWELRQYPWRKRLNALFYYDIPFMFSSFAESLLPRFGIRRMAGISRPFGVETLNQYGDETGHTAEQSAPFQGLDVLFAWTPPDPKQFKPSDSDSGKHLGAFLKRMQQRNIQVIGGLPTVPDSLTLPAEVVTTLRAFYANHGQQFATLDNHSQYPRHCFYDTGYHLNEECQIRHSQRVAKLLAPMLTAKPLANTRGISQQ